MVASSDVFPLQFLRTGEQPSRHTSQAMTTTEKSRRLRLADRPSAPTVPSYSLVIHSNLISGDLTSIHPGRLRLASC
jgi:hypothetical protein